MARHPLGPKDLVKGSPPDQEGDRLPMQDYAGTTKAVKREDVGFLAPSEPSLWVMGGGKRR